MPVIVSEGRLLWERAIALEPEGYTLRNIVAYRDKKFGAYNKDDDRLEFLFVDLATGDVYFAS